jgi:hypothetical protein
MALKLIKERTTGMYLAADFRDTAFVDSERVADENDATWLSTVDDWDAAILASVALVGDQFEVVDLHDCD